MTQESYSIISFLNKIKRMDKKRDGQTVRVGSRVGREKNIKNMGKNTSIKIRVPCSDRHAWFDGKRAALTHMKSLVKDMIEQLSSVISSTYEKT